VSPRRGVRDISSGVGRYLSRTFLILNCFHIDVNGYLSIIFYALLALPYQLILVLVSCRDRHIRRRIEEIMSAVGLIELNDLSNS
jgi:hypothetical protein